MAEQIKIVAEGIKAAGCSLSIEEITELVKRNRCNSDSAANYGEGTKAWGCKVETAVAFMTSHGIGFNPVEQAAAANEAAEPAAPAKGKGLKKAKGN